MKKNILTLALIFFISSNFVNAQKFSFGAKFSPLASWSKVSNTDFYNYENDEFKVGVGFGPSLKIKMSDSFNTEIGAIFTWQGTQFNQTPISMNPDSSMNYETKLQYLQIPVIFEGQFKIAKKLSAAINFGAIPSVSLSSLVDVKNNVTGDMIATDHDFSASMFNLFLSAGAGTYFEFTDGVSLSTIILYNNGVIDVWYDKSNAEYIKTLDMKNHYISLNIGLHIDF